MTTTDLSVQLEDAFKELKKELKLKSTFEEIDAIFFLKDYVLSEGYLSPKLSRTISRRIVDLYWSWNNYLHGIIMPNPSSMVVITESQMFDEQEREGIIALMNTIMAHVSRNSVIGLSRDSVAEAKFIDDSVNLWKTVQPKLLTIMIKVRDQWDQKSKAPVTPPRPGLQ